MGYSQRTGTIEIAELVKTSQAGDRRTLDELARLYQRRAMRAVGANRPVAHVPGPVFRKW